MITTAVANLRELPANSSHPLTADQCVTALRHAQRSFGGDCCYVLWNGYTTGATFVNKADVDASLAGTQPWVSSFQPGFHSHQCRIFKVTALGAVSELVQ